MYKRLINAFILAAFSFAVAVGIALVSILASPTLVASQGATPAGVESFAIAQRIDCSNAQTTPELKYCSQQSYQAADKQLNQAYQKVTSSIKGEQKQLLTTAQQAWIKFRDNNCNFEVYPNRGGTGYEIFRNGCLERLTKQRTKDLQDYLSNR
jgi:uncharacterized protein YecT (DUF1311 family)